MLNTNEAQRQRTARKDESLKITLELKLLRKIKPLFRKIAIELQKKYSRLGLFPSLLEFESDMEKELKTHYANVADIFSKRITNELGAPDNHEQVLESINSATTNHHEKRVVSSITSIINTVHKDMRDVIAGIITAATIRRVQLTRDEIGKKARVEFNKRAAGRANAIAMTETQNPAEHAKQAEIGFLAFHNAIINGKNINELKKLKKWVAILDTRTRHAHALADGLVVPFNEPYTVNGQLLMYPGDTSLGASLDNVINCRCSSVIIIR